MTTITSANFTFKDADGDLGTVKTLTDVDIVLLNNVLQDVEDLKFAIQQPCPVGLVGLWTDETIPAGWLLCNGAAVSRTNYARLFAKIGTRYGAGDGSTTFNVPDMRDRYPIGAGTNLTGTQVAEQLPNITGATANWSFHSGDTNTGALYRSNSGSTGSYAAGGGTYGYGQINLDASLSNSIYTNNGKVYPASIALNFIIKT